MNLRLVICEKPSVAKSIAAVLNASQRKDGFFIDGDWIKTYVAAIVLDDSGGKLGYKLEFNAGGTVNG